MRTFGGLAILLMAGCISTRLDDPHPTGPRPAAGAAYIPVGQPAGIASRIVRLSGDNTRVTFIGTAGKSSHEGAFDRLSGEWMLPTDDIKDSQFAVRIDIDSVRTRIGLLTDHLKQDDFFDTKKFPTAAFVSNAIEPEPGKDGATHRVTGEFTIHGVTRRVIFPAKIAVNSNAVSLDAKFTIKQSEYGMARAMESARDDVAVTVSLNASRR